MFHKLIFREILQGASIRLQWELSNFVPLPLEERHFHSYAAKTTWEQVLPSTTANKWWGCSDLNLAFNQVIQQNLEYLSFIELVQSSFFLRKLFDFICKLFYFFVCISQSSLKDLFFLSEVKWLLLPSDIFHHHRLLFMASFLTFLVCLEKYQIRMNQSCIS